MNLPRQPRRIEGRIDPRNIASAKPLEKAGFVREAYFKESYYLQGGFADTAVYSILTPYAESTNGREKRPEPVIKKALAAAAFFSFAFRFVQNNKFYKTTLCRVAADL